MKAERHFQFGQTRSIVFFLGLVFAFFMIGGMPSSLAEQAHVNEMLYLKKATYVGMDTCAQCHDKEYTDAIPSALSSSRIRREDELYGLP
jgi:hypothetical protein